MLSKALRLRFKKCEVLLSGQNYSTDTCSDKTSKCSRYTTSVYIPDVDKIPKCSHYTTSVDIQAVVKTSKYRNKTSSAYVLTNDISTRILYNVHKVGEALQKSSALSSVTPNAERPALGSSLPANLLRKCPSMKNSVLVNCQRSEMLLLYAGKMKYSIMKNRRSFTTSACVNEESGSDTKSVSTTDDDDDDADDDDKLLDEYKVKEHHATGVDKCDPRNSTKVDEYVNLYHYDIQEKQNSLSEPQMERQIDGGNSSLHEMDLNFPVREKQFDSLPAESYSLAPYVEKSDTLTQLVKLGVDLSMVEKDQVIANYILRLDFERHVKPVLYFFKDIGIKDGDIATVITKNPYVLTNCGLEVIVDYLQSKNFDAASLTRIITKCPAFMSMDVREIDEKLGFYQREFRLTGYEVRKVISQQPRLIGWDTEKIKEIKIHMRELLGFSEVEMRKMFLTQPTVFMLGKHDIEKKFDFLHNNMGLTHERIVQWPFILRTRLSRVRSRHKYLVYLGRNQYDGRVENYVSLKALVSQSDKDWCIQVARTDVNDYYDFLRTI